LRLRLRTRTRLEHYGRMRWQRRLSVRCAQCRGEAGNVLGRRAEIPDIHKYYAKENGSRKPAISPPGSRALHPRTTAESTMNVAEGLAFGRQEQWTCYKYRAVSEESARKQWVNRGRAGRRRQYPRAHRDRLCSRPASPPICKADPKELTRWVRRVFRE
jgi:hypothetical protein